MEKKIKISILVIVKKWDSKTDRFNYIKDFQHSNVDYEVLIGEGQNPSYQRNELVRIATGDYVLFFDDDSRPVENLLDIYNKVIKTYPEVMVIGGPALLTPIKSNNYVKNLSKLFFSNKFGVGPVVYRYNSIGVTRNASEKELILCNLLMKKSYFLKSSGFDQTLYPGEENEFLKRSENKLDLNKILYEPSAIVYRNSRETFQDFIIQMLRYGRGRAKHLKLNKIFELLLLIPSGFLLYLFILPTLIKYSLWFLFPLVLHLLSSGFIIIKSNQLKLSLLNKMLLPFFFISGHCAYGLGILWGIVHYRLFLSFGLNKKNRNEVKIFILKNFP